MNEEILDAMRSELDGQIINWHTHALLGTVFGAVMTAGLAFVGGRLTAMESVLAAAAPVVVLTITTVSVYLAMWGLLPYLVEWTFDGEFEVGENGEIERRENAGDPE